MAPKQRKTLEIPEIKDLTTVTKNKNITKYIATSMNISLLSVYK